MYFHMCTFTFLCFLLSLILFTFIFFIKMHPVGFEPTHLSIAVLETAPLDHSGTNALHFFYFLPVVLL